MSELNGTVTSTPEEKWGLMADATDGDTTERDTPPVAADISEVSTAKATDEQQSAEDATAEEVTDVEEVTDEVARTGKKRRNRGSVRRSRSTRDSAPGGGFWRKLLTIRRIAVGAVAAIAIAAVVVAVMLAASSGAKLDEEQNIDAAAAEARAAAEQYAVTLTSVSSDTLDQNFAAVLDGATGEFKDMYSQSSGQLRDLLVENKAYAEGKVIDSGIKSATTSKVEVMLFVDQSVTNTATPDARIDRSRVLMTMEKIDGRWLASKVDLP